jgi:hypothetical protein
MNRIKILALLAAVALLALLPLGLHAQQLDPPHKFYGVATLEDGTIAPDGTVVAAWIDGAEVSTAMVESSFEVGFYLLDVAQAEGDVFAGEMVAFTVGGVATSDSIAWESRMSQELNLVAMAGAMEVTPEPFMEEGAGLAIGLFGNNRSGQSGRATFTEIGDDLEVVISVNPGALTSELAHIHNGTCESTGGIDHPLTSFEGGSGVTTMLVEGVTLAHVQDGDHYINIHMAGNPGTSTACGNIPADGEDQPLPMRMVPDPVDTDDLKAELLTTLRLEAGLNAPRVSDGADGAAGARGPAGSAGAQGAQGNPGAVGANGQAGADGPAGARGPEGDSGGVGLAIVALILAIVALAGAGGAFAMGRRS